MNASVKLIEQVIPSTVTIRVTVPPQHKSAQLLGTERMGSGAVIDTDGYILTVNYIVIGASSVKVSMEEKKKIEDEDRGDGFLIKGGECEENFDDFREDYIRDKIKILMQMYVILNYGD